MLTANRIVKYFIPVVMLAAVLSALGVATLVAGFTAPDRLVDVVWIVTIVVLALVVTSVPLLYIVAQRATRLHGSSDPDEPSTPFAGRRAGGITAFRLVNPRREHAALVAVSIEGLARLMEVLPAETAAEAFHVVLAACDHTVRGHGGVIERFLDRDALFIFRGKIFGVGPEEAAARAALELAELVPQLTVPGQSGPLRGLRFLAGITAGSVMIGELRETGAKDPARLTVFSDLTNQARCVLNAARNRGVDVLVTTYIASRTRESFCLTASGVVNEMLAHQRIEVFVLEKGVTAPSGPAYDPARNRAL